MYFLRLQIIKKKNNNNIFSGDTVGMAENKRYIYQKIPRIHTAITTVIEDFLSVTTTAVLCT